MTDKNELSPEQLKHFNEVKDQFPRTDLNAKNIGERFDDADLFLQEIHAAIKAGKTVRHDDDPMRLSIGFIDEKETDRSKRKYIKLSSLRNSKTPNKTYEEIRKLLPIN